MADIEERAAKAWEDWHAEVGHYEMDSCTECERIFLAGYLAGAAQAQHDYVAHYERVQRA